MLRKEQVRAVGVSFAILALVYPSWYTYSIILPYIADDLQWSRATAAGGLAILVFVHALSAVPVGRLCDQFGARNVVRLGSLLLATALGLSSLIREPWQLYLLYGVLGGFGLALSGWVPAVTAINRQFRRRVSTATGIASMGIGVGALVGAPLIHQLIVNSDWRRAVLVNALIIFLGVQVMALLLPKASKAGRKLEWSNSLGEITLIFSKVMRLNRFWLLIAAFFSYSFGIQLLLAHQVAYLIDSAWDPILAAAVVAIVGVLSLPLRPILGNSSDQIGREPTYSLGAMALLAAIAMLSTLSIRPDWRAGLYLYAAFMATAYSTVAPVYPAVASDLFRGSDYGLIYGLLTLGSGLGSTLGILSGGIVFDIFNDYRAGFAIAAVLAVLATVFVWLAAPRHGLAIAEYRQT